MAFKIRVEFTSTERQSSKFLREYQNELKRGVNEAVVIANNANIKASPVTFGLLRQSWQKRQAQVNGNIIIGASTSSATQATIIDKGAAPHFPPIDAIAAWAQRTLGTSKEKARDRAFKIARAISRRGLPSAQGPKLGLFTDTFKRIEPKMTERIGASIERASRLFSK